MLVYIHVVTNKINLVSETLKTSLKFDLAYNKSIRWRRNLLLFLSTSALSGIHVYFHEQKEYNFVAGIFLISFIGFQQNIMAC